MLSPASKSVLSIHGLTRKFNNQTAVDNLSFDVVEGEIFGLLGPNGAGKTTTINMICGILAPTSGAIHYKHSDEVRDVRQVIGYCPQENIFYPKLTCYEQLIFIATMYGFSIKESKLRSKRLLDQMGLTDKTHVLASKLSGGMKRRLNICFALIHNPKILVLDEPEAGLDPQSRVLVRDFIKSLAREKTVMITTHNMDEADRLSDRVAIIDYGKLLLLDTPENLKKSLGEGDIMELELDSDDPGRMNPLVNQLSKISSEVNIMKNILRIRSMDIIENIPVITSIIRDQGFTVTEIRMRENTLEDVFIYLTGRKLRE
jgi:ABC-2 type transport system ATP-binding protein